VSPVAGARYAQQQIAGGGGPTPPLAGYVVWYDPSDAASITSSGGAVSQLNDKSGNGRHLTQATSGFRPTTGTRTQNGLNVLDYDGTDDFLEAAGFTIAQPVTVFLVAASDDGGDSTLQKMFDNQATASFFISKTAANTWGANAGAAFGGPPIGIDSVAHIHTAVFNGASSIRYVDASTGATLNGGANGLDGVRLANARSGVAGSWWDGPIGEVLVYPSALNTTDVTTVLGYLKAKWNTP